MPLRTQGMAASPGAVARMIGRVGPFVLCALLFLTNAGLVCAPAAPPPVQPDDVRTIQDFVSCINGALAGNANVTIADTIQCLPKKCSITLTMSDTSAQPACKIGDCQLPRVLLDCPGPPRFMPSYLLCASDAGSNRVEIGQAIDQAGNMQMGDLEIKPGAFTAIDPNDVLSVDDSKGCNSNGTNCHASFGPQKYSGRIDPFDGSEGSSGNPNCIIDTDDCRHKPIAETKNCFDKQASPESLADVCACIRSSLLDLESDLAQSENGETVGKICDALEGYQSTRGACAVAGCPASTGPACSDAFAPCDPSTGATVQVDSGYHCTTEDEVVFQCVADCPCHEYDLLGGGKFLVNGAVSMVRLQIGGLVPTGNPSSFADFDGVTGQLSAFEYFDRTYVQSVSLASVQGTQTGADFSVTGTGTALVNGVSTPIEFAATQTGGVATFEVRDAGTLTFLAGGTGEDARSAFQLTVGP